MLPRPNILLELASALPSWLPHDQKPAPRPPFWKCFLLAFPPHVFHSLSATQCTVARETKWETVVILTLTIYDSFYHTWLPFICPHMLHIPSLVLSCSCDSDLLAHLHSAKTFLTPSFCVDAALLAYIKCELLARNRLLLVEKACITARSARELRLLLLR